MRRLVNRPADLAARIGGEEFAILLPHTDSRGATHVAETLRAEIEALALAVGESGCLTASIGVATLAAGLHQAPGVTLVAAADGALYVAKARGRNGVATSPLIIVAASPGTSHVGHHSVMSFHR